jgi:YidC/Oxa1 family membrane protein insertase
MTFFEAVIFPGPIYNALIVLYNVLGDFGLSIIVITLVVRGALLPLNNKAFRSQRRLQALQPEIQKLQEKHKDDREALARETMEFYKKEGVSPASSCLPTLIQLPILLVLYFAFKDAVGGQHLDDLYSFVSVPETINTHFLGLTDLAQTPINIFKDTGNILAFTMPALAGIATFVQSRMILPKGPNTPALTKQMSMILPLLTAVFATTLPQALALYWITTTTFTIVQQAVIMRELPEAKARAEGAADWNAANPSDPVSPVIDAKGKKGSPAASASRTKKGSTSVTVRKRGDK